MKKTRNQHKNSEGSWVCLENKKKTKKKVEEALKKTNEVMKWRINKSREEAIEYKEEDYYDLSP